MMPEATVLTSCGETQNFLCMSGFVQGWAPNSLRQFPILSRQLGYCSGKLSLLGGAVGAAERGPGFVPRREGRLRSSYRRVKLVSLSRCQDKLVARLAGS